VWNAGGDRVEIDAAATRTGGGWSVDLGGLPAGMASHRPDVHLEAEKRRFPTDFYFQCFYNPRQGYREQDRQKAIATIQQMAKPVVGYKKTCSGRRGSR